MSEENFVRPDFWRPRATTREDFGGCPACGGNDGWVRASGERWFACHRHRTRWRAGIDLLDEDETRTLERIQLGRIVERDYERVRPVFPNLLSLPGGPAR